MIADDDVGGRVDVAEMPELQREALLQVARGDADRVEVLEDEQDRLDLRLRPAAHLGELVDRRHQVTVVVQVADDGLADLALVGRDVGAHRQLPKQMVGQ